VCYAAQYQPAGADVPVTYVGLFRPHVTIVFTWFIG
jgi:hypothetical protein